MTKPNEQAYAKNWITKRLRPARVRALQVYQALSQQLCEVFAREYVEPVHQSFFYELMEQLWPKYLQAFLNEMAAELKSKRLVLADDEFFDMPDSWLDNLDDFALFEDYLTSDL